MNENEMALVKVRGILMNLMKVGKHIETKRRERREVADFAAAYETLCIVSDALAAANANKNL